MGRRCSPRCRAPGAAVLSLLATATCVLGRPTGLVLLGNPKAHEPPTLSFGAGAGEFVVTERGGALEVLRGNVPQMALSEQAIEFPNTALAGDFVGSAFNVDGVPQWKLWDIDTFDAEPMRNWTVNERAHCASPNDRALGGHCHFAATSTSRRYDGLPPHVRVRVTARVHFIDKWEGESVLLQLDGSTVWAESHNWCPSFMQWKCEKYGISSCGGKTPDRMSVKVEAVVPHGASSLDVLFASSLRAGADPCQASWAVDDVSVELM